MKNKNEVLLNVIIKYVKTEGEELVSKCGHASVREVRREETRRRKRRRK